MSEAPACRFAVISVPRGIPSFASRRAKLLYGRLLSNGLEIPEICGRVEMCRPSPCIVTWSTSLRFVEPVKYSIEELKHNYVVRVEMEEGASDVLVYPKRVWDAVKRNVIDPFIEGRELAQQGVILYGPPGTGKTSLAEILAHVSRVALVKISLPTVVSMWLGESEKRLFAQLKRAEACEPSIAFADDAEWLLQARHLRGGVAGASEVYENMTRIILDVVERWNRQRRAILFVTATNAPPETLDKALMRSGRIGAPIYVPLPDYEAVFEFLRIGGVDDETADRWATKVVNLGISMADVKKKILPSLLKGEEPEVEPQREEGYRRFVVDIRVGRDVVDRVFSALDEVAGLSRVLRVRMERGMQSMVWFNAPYPIALAFANAFLSMQCKVPTVTMVDVRKIDSAVEAAKILRAALIVPSYLPPEAVLAIRSEAPCIVFVGKEHPRLSVGEEIMEIPLDPRRLSLGRRISGIEVMMAIAAATLSFYGVSYSEEELRKLCYTHDIDGFFRKLSIAGSYGDRLVDLVKTPS